MKLDSKYFDCVRVKPIHDEPVDQHGPICQWRGCQSAGLHRAPKGRGREGQYYFLCLAHVREFNASYNYFEGMSNTDIEAYQKDSVIGHREMARGCANPGARHTLHAVSGAAGSAKAVHAPIGFPPGAPTRGLGPRTAAAVGSSPWIEVPKRPK